MAFAGDSDAEPDIFDLSLEELGKVVITTASRSAETISSAPASITLISHEQIVRSGARSLFEVLESVPGFTGLHSINAGRNFVVRGIASDNGLLVLQDGTAVNDAFFGNYSFFEQAIDDVERIEVVRGPGSALYGGNALLGVINIISRKPTPGTDSAYWRSGIGAHDGLEAGVSVNLELPQQLEGLSLAMGLTHRSSDGDSLFIEQDSLYTPVPGRFMPPLTNPTLTPTTRAETQLVDNIYLNAQYGKATLHYVYNRIETAPRFSFRGVVTEPGDTLRVEALNSATLSYQKQVSDVLSFTPKVYYSLFQSKFLGDSQPPQYWADEDQDGRNEAFPSGIIENLIHETKNYGVDWQTDWALNNDHNLSLSLVFDRTLLSQAQKLANVSLIGRAPIPVFPISDMTQEYIATDVNRDMSAGLLEYRWQIDPALTLTAGLRASRYSDFGHTNNPRLALVYQINPLWYGKLLYGNAFVPPSFAQLFDRTPATNLARVRGNADLQASEIKTSELVLGYQPNTRTDAQLTLFQNSTSNEIYFDATIGTEQWLNGGARRSRGIELAVQAQPYEWLTLNSNITSQQSMDNDQGSAANIHPHLRAMLSANFSLPHAMELYGALRYSGAAEREPGDPRSNMPAKTYVDINWRALQVQPNLNLVFRVDNILDENGRDEVNQSEGIPDDIARAGRGYWLSLEYRLH